LHTPGTILYKTLCHSLKPSFQPLEALKCLMLSLIVMCRVFSLSSVSLIIALLLLACLNHTTPQTLQVLKWWLVQAVHLTREPDILCITVFIVCLVSNSSVQCWWHNS
jgi:hypothetical protein